MKLSGNKRKGRHVNKHTDIASEDNFNFAEIGAPDQKTKKTKKPMSKKRKILTVFSIIIAVLIVGAGCIYFYVRTALDTKPPARVNPTADIFFTPVDPAVPQLPVPKTESAQNKVEYIRDTKVLKYTFLMLALDDGNGNTDVIMAATLDVTNHTLEIVSIPRDTLANVSWSVKKANSIYANLRAQNGADDKLLNESMDGAVEKFADILGFKVDYWFLVDMKAVVALINAIEGVDYNVPVNMNYDDVQAGLSIHFNQGMQHLNGQQALELLRFRRYADADIGRIGTQQDFLMTAAKQILAKKSSIDIIELANIILNYVKTDIVLADLIWFGREFLKLESDDINFSTLPGNYWDSFNGDSYVTIYVDQWLELVNSKLNPFNVDIMPDDVSILTRGADGRLYVTDGNRQGNPQWGAGVGQGYSGEGSENNSPASSSAPQTGDSGSNPPDNTGEQTGDADVNSGDGTPDGSPDDTDIDLNEDISGDNEDDPDNPPDANPDETAPPIETDSPEDEPPLSPDVADEPPAPAPAEENPPEAPQPEMQEE